jgi:uncharacterized protein (TIGR01777 family)
MTERAIAVTGASGLLGRALCERLRRRGDRVIELVRRAARNRDELSWDPESGTLDETALEDLYGVVHLAGENVASERWSPAFKRRIRDSRVLGTRTLVAALARTRRPPRVLLSASGVGYYGDRGDTWLDEASGPGNGFLAEVCQEWEAAARQLDGQARTAQLRIGMVLGRGGGALATMLPFFRWGLGGPLGSGKQYVSWISLEDVVGATLHALDAELRGPVNLVGPNPMPQRDFARALGKAVGRPAFLPAPSVALRLVLGEFAGEALAGQRVRPAKLLQTGFSFRHPELSDALEAALS